MLRLLSILLLLCGLGAAGYAGSVLLDTYAPRDDVVVAAPAQEMATEQAFEEAAPPALEEELCLLYTSPSPRDRQKSRMPSSA